MTEALENLSQLIDKWLAGPAPGYTGGHPYLVHTLLPFQYPSGNRICRRHGAKGYKTSISVVAHFCSRSSCDIYYTWRDCFHRRAAHGNIRIVVVYHTWSTNGIDGFADMGYI